MFIKQTKKKPVAPAPVAPQPAPTIARVPQPAPVAVETEVRNRPVSATPDNDPALLAYRIIQGK